MNKLIDKLWKQSEEKEIRLSELINAIARDALTPLRSEYVSDMLGSDGVLQVETYR